VQPCTLRLDFLHLGMEYMSCNIQQNGSLHFN
jgi:hypothetical protein